MSSVVDVGGGRGTEEQLSLFNNPSNGYVPNTIFCGDDVVKTCGCTTKEETLTRWFNAVRFLPLLFGKGGVVERCRILICSYRDIQMQIVEKGIDYEKTFDDLRAIFLIIVRWHRVD